VPAELGPHLGERTWLALGAVVVPLPVTVEAEPRPPAPPPEPEAVPGDEPITAEEPRGPEQGIDAIRRRATEAETRAAELAVKVEALERDLEEAREEPDQLRAMLANRERERRIAEQRVHAERALRAEVEEELARQGGEEGVSPEALADARSLEQRVEQLERELEGVRREAAEAENLAAAATAARSRAERELAELHAAAPGRAPPRAERLSPVLRSERLLSKRSQDTSVSVEAAARVAQRQGVDGSAPLEAARIERGLVAARQKPARGPQLESRVDGLRSELGQLRREHEQARDRAEQETARRVEAEEQVAKLQRQVVELRDRCVRAYQAISEIRAQLSELRSPPPAAPSEPPEEAPPPPSSEPAPPESEAAPSQAAGAEEAQRLSEALMRLREATLPSADAPDTTQEAPPGPEGAAPQPPEEAAPQPPKEPPPQAEEPPPQPQPPAPRRRAKPWLPRVYRQLVARDPITAGRLLLALLPAQRVVAPQPVAYDLILGDFASVQVTVGKEATDVELRDEPRAPDQVHFQVRGDLASLARLVVARRIRRRLGRRLARVSGERARFAALKKLVRSSMTLGELHAAGARPDPLLAFTLASLMVDVRWTAGERFTVAHQATQTGSPGAYLNVRSGDPLLISDRPPQRPIATTIVCQPDALLAVLAGAHPADVFVRGETRPLELLREWLERAQSG
jgi:uncharacterized membrane protein